MTVELDYLENAEVVHDERGIVARRTGRLSDITGNPEAKPRAALEAVGLPRYGDPHPAWNNLKASTIVLRAIDVKQWQVEIEYREPTANEKALSTPIGEVVEVTWFSTNVTIDVLYDARGRRMFHWYAGYPTSLQISGGRIFETSTGGRQLGVKAERGSVQIPSVGARVLMAEATDPRKRLGFIGKVNSNFWSGFKPRTWLFAGLAGNLDRGRWLNTYEIIYREDTWRLRSDIEFNGVPPSDASVGNGIRFFDVYPLRNFNNLGFSL